MLAGSRLVSWGTVRPVHSHSRDCARRLLLLALLLEVPLGPRLVVTTESLAAVPNPSVAPDLVG